VSDRIIEMSVEALAEQLRITEANFTERITELEYELEERGWERLFGSQDIEFSRDALRKIARESRLFYLKNPLIHRAVELENSYVFGQGVTIEADHTTVDEIVQTFVADEINRQEIATPRAMAGLNRELKIDGNLFLAFFGNGGGLVRVRSIPFDEIQDVISNPEDAKEPWYYHRRSIPRASLLGGVGQPVKEVLYPDWQYTPQDRPDSFNGVRIDWDHPVYHITVNRLSGQRFGCSEIYPAQDWARAYNEFLANWATITRSLARFAWKAVTKGGPNQRAAIKSGLDSGISSGGDYNPAPAAGSMWIESEQTNLQPMKTAGSTTSPSDGRRLLLMVCAAMGFPETFFGDAEVGTLATAKSLDRPTELAMLGRQRLWQEIVENVLGYAIEQAARYATVEGVSGNEILDDWDELKWVYANDPETGEPLNVHVSISFPSIVERSVTEAVDAIVKASTLGGTTFAGTLDPEYTTRQLLIALGEHSVEEVIADLFPEDEEVPETLIPQTEALRRDMANFLTLLKEARVEE
jgi:hypothetical protein